ncbi:uncharacterized protein [Argopecten irradians]|uniref:uncharacterized protein isoform X1 n=1 Tax=Argopecten irradians TaxID=31199 RepID=UPI00371AF4E6
MAAVEPITIRSAVQTNGAIAAEECKQSFGGSSTWHYYIYCEHDCCGTYYDQECCADFTGLIVGCVIGAVLFFGGIIFLVCLCHHCNKKKTVGVIMTQPAQPGGTNVNFGM